MLRLVYLLTVILSVSLCIAGCSQSEKKPELPSIPGPISFARWQEIKRHFKETDRDFNERPAISSTCFVTENSLAWLNPKGFEFLQQQCAKYAKTRTNESSNFFGDEAAIQKAASESNGLLIKLSPGTKVKILEGVWSSPPEFQHFVGMQGKIEILTGEHEGTTCFNDGAALKSKLKDTSEFFKSKEEAKAFSCLLIAKTLAEPLETLLAEAGVEISPALPGDEEVSLTENDSVENSNPANVVLKMYKENPPGKGLSADPLQNESFLNSFFDKNLSAVLTTAISEGRLDADPFYDTNGDVSISDLQVTNVLIDAKYIATVDLTFRQNNEELHKKRFLLKQVDNEWKIFDVIDQDKTHWLSSFAQ